jgi:hypothetical protein
MTRRKRSTEPAPTAPARTVEFGQVDAVGLLTVDGLATTREVKGQIVRVRPPTGASAEQIEQARLQLLAAGARAVKVDPAAEAVVTLAEADGPPSEQEPVRSEATLREVVTLCAGRVRGLEDKAALMKALDQVLSAVGL